MKNLLFRPYMVGLNHRYNDFTPQPVDFPIDFVFAWVPEWGNSRALYMKESIKDDGEKPDVYIVLYING